MSKNANTPEDIGFVWEGAGGVVKVYNGRHRPPPKERKQMRLESAFGGRLEGLVHVKSALDYRLVFRW